MLLKNGKTIILTFGIEPHYQIESFSFTSKMREQSPILSMWGIWACTLLTSSWLAANQGRYKMYRLYTIIQWTTCHYAVPEKKGLSLSIFFYQTFTQTCHNRKIKNYLLFSFTMNFSIIHQYTILTYHCLDKGIITSEALCISKSACDYIIECYMRGKRTINEGRMQRKQEQF